MAMYHVNVYVGTIVATFSHLCFPVALSSFVPSILPSVFLDLFFWTNFIIPELKPILVFCLLQFHVVVYPFSLVNKCLLYLYVEINRNLFSNLLVLTYTEVTNCATTGQFVDTDRAKNSINAV